MLSNKARVKQNSRHDAKVLCLPSTFEGLGGCLDEYVKVKKKTTRELNKVHVKGSTLTVHQ
jgi:hypothetical protein